MTLHLEFESEIPLDEQFEDYVRRSLSTVDKRWGDRITRVTVYIKDQNSKVKGGIDTQCTLEARPAGMDPVAVDDVAAGVRDAVKGASEKLEKALERAEGRKQR